jgi:hypothetical protein
MIHHRTRLRGWEDRHDTSTKMSSLIDYLLQAQINTSVMTFWEARVKPKPITMIGGVSDT